MDFKTLSNFDLLNRLDTMVQAEKRLTAEIIEFVKEVDRRKLYLDLGYTSLFQFMTERLGYTPGSAQRRIDSARMLKDLPELKEQLKSGDLNLMQVSILARAVREKEKTSPVSVDQKREVLQAIQSQDILKSELTIAKMLDVPIKTKETKRLQQDESLRFEVTLSKSQAALLDQVKSLISHTHPNPDVAEILEYLARKFVEQKLGRTEMKVSTSTAKMAVSKNPKYISARTRKQLLEQQPCCQWKTAGDICGSRHQLQIDHIQPIWAGGKSEPENLQVLCAVHNRLRYRRQANLEFSF